MYQITGKINSTNAAEFEKEIMVAKPAELDASQLEYISSAGLRFLISVNDRMVNKKGMILRNVRKETMEIFDIAGLSIILTIERGEQT